MVTDHDPSDEVPSAISDILDMLSDARCRVFIYGMMEYEDDVADYETVVELVDDVSAEMATEPIELSRQSLHHVILPKLKSKGVLEYDPRTETIRYYGDPMLDKYAELMCRDELG